MMKTVPAGRAIDWFKAGWRVFSSDIATWLILAVIYLLIMVVLMMIPIIGSTIYYLIAPTLVAGLLLAAGKSLDGGKARVEDLFAPLRNETTRNPLLMLGAILLAANVLLAILGVGMVGGFGMHGMNGAGLFGGLLALIASLAIGAAFLYAPAEVVFRNTPPVDAIKASLSAVMANIPAMLVFGLGYILLSIVAIIPLGLGMLVLLPVMMGALLASYRDIF